MCIRYPLDRERNERVVIQEHVLALAAGGAAQKIFGRGDDELAAPAAARHESGGLRVGALPNERASGIA